MAETRLLALAVGGAPAPTPCDVFGTEGSPQALLLPALSSVSERAEMAALAEDLARDHRCLVPDWPGFGAHPRAALPLTPDTLHAFLDALLEAAPGPYALAVAAGHAAAYLAAAAARRPGRFGRLALVAPTWRGPLPTMMGPERAGLCRAVRRVIEAPLVGPALYRVNVSQLIIARMLRAHVYGDPAAVTPDLIARKQAVALQPRGRFGTAAFVAGGLDPVASRAEFLSLFPRSLPPVLLLRPERAPPRSGGEMDALGAHLSARGIGETRRIPGALAAHEEHPGAIAAIIRAW